MGPVDCLFACSAAYLLKRLVGHSNTRHNAARDPEATRWPSDMKPPIVTVFEWRSNIWRLALHFSRRSGRSFTRCGTINISKKFWTVLWSGLRTGGNYESCHVYSANSKTLLLKLWWWSYKSSLSSSLPPANAENTVVGTLERSHDQAVPFFPFGRDMPSIGMHIALLAEEHHRHLFEMFRNSNNVRHGPGWNVWVEGKKYRIWPRWKAKAFSSLFETNRQKRQKQEWLGKTRSGGWRLQVQSLK